MIKDVEAFHKKFGLLCPDVPRRLTERKINERVEFMQEELDEFLEAALNGNIDGVADALVDLVYVALGTAVMMGLPWDRLWNEVHQKNMAKVRGITKRGHPVDVTKPPGWTPPNHMPALLEAGWNPHSLPLDDDQ